MNTKHMLTKIGRPAGADQARRAKDLGMNRNTFGLLSLFGGSLLAASCAEPVGDINTVQPHYLSKSTFDGEWIYRQTVVDVSPELASAFVGLEGALEKIRWEVREEQLLGYRTHEAIPGLDEESELEGSDFKGDPVVSFPIASHFDIRRGYNASTGEETNEIVENSSDRPWQDREFFRVDWAGAVWNGPVDMGFVRSWALAEDYVRETEVFDPDHLQVTDNYIQMTTETVLSDGWLLCYYTYGTYNCGSANAKVRFSFSKIDPETYPQFEPRDYLDNVPLRDDDGRILRTMQLRVGRGEEVAELACTDDLMQFLDEMTAPGYFNYLDDCREVRYPQFEKFGFFRTERYRFDRRVGGGHDQNREFYANTHNIWKNPMVEGEDGTWSPRPAAERDARPVIYYLNAGYPADLEKVAGQMSNDWDEAFIGAVTAASGKSADAIRKQVAADFGGEDWEYLEGDAQKQGGMFQIRRNTCSPQGVAAYVKKFPSMQAVVDDATEGEKLLTGNIGRACAGLTHFSRVEGLDPPFTWQQVGDVRFSFVNWVNEPQISGPLGYGPSSIDKENGHIMSGNAHVYGAAVDTYARSAADIVRLMNEDLELDALLSGKNYEEWLARDNSFADMELDLKPEMLDRVNARMGGFRVEQAYGPYKLPDGKMDRAALMKQMRQRLHNPHPDDPMAKVMNLPVDEGRARLEALKQDPRFRAKLATPDDLAILRPIYGWEPGDEVSEEMEAAAVDLGIDRTAFAQRQKERFQFFSGRGAESPCLYMAEFIDDSVVGTAMALKGLPAEEVFKQLRESIFRGVMLHEIGHTLGMTHNFSASYDALNYHDDFWRIRAEHPESEWDEQRLPEYRYASIMDYGGRFNSDFQGLGKYDRAAIKFVYGKSSEVFGKDVDVSSTLDFDAFVDGYTVLPALVGGEDRNGNGVLDEGEDKDDDGDLDVAYENLFDREDVPTVDLMKERRDGVLDNARVFASNPNAPGGEFWYNRTVPYEYCFDIFNGNLRCQTWDEGASVTETVRSAIQNYWNYYAFNNYRRGRSETGFINGYFSRQDRLNWYLTTPFRYFYFYQQWDIGLRQDLYEAALIGLNFINQVLGTPVPGRHCLDPERNLYVPIGQIPADQQADCETLDVPEGTGREELVRYNDEYYYQLDYIGSYYDKLNFLYNLMDTTTSFFGVSNLGDRRAFSIGFYRVYRDELVGLLRDLVMTWLGFEQGDAFNSFVDVEAGPDGRFVPRALVEAEAFSQGDLEGSPRLQSPVGYNLIWRALALSAVFNTSTYDSQLDFANYLAVAELGSGEDFEAGEDFDSTVFVNPHTQVAYKAVQTRDRRSISYDLLRRSQAYADDTWAPAKAAFDAIAEDLRTLEAQAAGGQSVDEAELTRLRGIRRAYDTADHRLQEIGDLVSDLRLIRSAVDWSND